MRPLSIVTGTAYPLGLHNVDTDTIIPARWLKTVDREGLAPGAFERLRAKPGQSLRWTPAFSQSQILIAGCNYGCGSSREHAAWAVAEMGIRVVIAPSFADIHQTNLLKNGMLPVALPEDQVDQLLAAARQGRTITVDLPRQVVEVAPFISYPFLVDPFRRECLLRGLDEIEVTLGLEQAIDHHERCVEAEEPWVFRTRRRVDRSTI